MTEEPLDHKLAAIRAAIDAVDAKLLALLNERAALSIEAGMAKAGGDAVYRPGREAELLRGIMTASPGPLPGSHLEAVYREILSSSRALQRVENVGFCGLPQGDSAHGGTLMEAHQVAWRALGTRNRYTALAEPVEVFRCVHERQCDMGIVPLETASGGYLNQVIDLFSLFPVFIRAEFFDRHGHNGMDGAGGVAQTGAASAQPAEWTRYVLLGITPADRPAPDKSSILFSLKDYTRRLPQVLKLFSDAGLSVARLQTRPQAGEARQNTYFAELPGDILADQFAPALAEATEICGNMRILGCYPAGSL